MPTECNKACFKLLRCSLSYAKIMPTECNKACFKLLRCSLSYAKIIIIVIYGDLISIKNANFA